MPTSMLDSLTRLIAPSVTSRLAGVTGDSEAAIGKGLTAAIPAILALISNRAGNNDLVSQLFALAKDPAADPTVLDHPERLVMSPPAGPDAGPSGRLQSMLLGGQARGLTEAISSFAGVKASTATSIIGTAIPMVLAYFSRLIRQDNLDSDGLARRLESERSSALAAIPAGLSGLLPAGLFGGAVTSMGGAMAAAGAAGASAAATASRGLSPLAWVSVAAVALLGL